MKKERIEVTRNKNYISFYLVIGNQRHWLFSQDFSVSVYDYFKFGKSIKEIRNFNSWRSNPRLSKTVERIPAMLRYIRKEYQIPNKEGKRKYYRTTYRDMYSI